MQSPIAEIRPKEINLVFCIFLIFQKINTVGNSNADVPLADPGMYQLDITLRRGQSLAARDRGGKHFRKVSPQSFFYVLVADFVFFVNFGFRDTLCYVTWLLWSGRYSFHNSNPAGEVSTKLLQYWFLSAWYQWHEYIILTYTCMEVSTHSNR